MTNIAGTKYWYKLMTLRLGTTHNYNYLAGGASLGTYDVAGYNPVLVMDVWEHAFILDYKPADRPKYIEAFFSNINWQAVESRLGTKRSSPSAAA